MTSLREYVNSCVEFKPSKYLPPESPNAFNVWSCSWIGRKGKDQEFQGIDRRRSQRLQQCLVEIWYKHCVQGNQRFFSAFTMCVSIRATHMPSCPERQSNPRCSVEVQTIPFDEIIDTKAMPASESCLRAADALLCFELNEKLQTFSELTEKLHNRVAIFVDVKDLSQAIKEPGMQPFLDPRNLSDFNFKPCLEVCGLPWFTISQNLGKCARSAIVCFDFDSFPLPLVELHTKVSLLVPPFILVQVHCNFVCSSFL